MTHVARLVFTFLFFVWGVNSSSLFPVGGTLSCVSGGYGDVPMYSTECYNATASAWQLQPSLLLPANRWDMAAFSLGSVVCLASPYQSMLCTNGSGWQSRTAVSATRGAAAAIYGDGWIGLAGGYQHWEDQNSPTWDRSVVRPINDGTDGVDFNWTTRPFEARLWTVVIPFNGSVCLLGGCNFTADSTIIVTQSNVCLQDVGHGVLNWTDNLLPSWTAFGYRHVAFPMQFNGWACAGGGQDNNFKLLSTVECFDFVNRNKTTFATPPGFQTVVGVANISLYGLPCITGGRNNSIYSNEVWCLNFTGMNWLSMPPLITNRSQHASFMFGAAPSPSPTLNPTLSPTRNPSRSPTRSPSLSPTRSPSMSPTLNPTISPTLAPSLSPTLSPSLNPTSSPTTAPTMAPTVLNPGDIVVVSQPNSGVASSPSPPPGQAVVQIALSLGVNQTATAQQIAEQVLSSLYLQLSLNGVDASAMGYSKVTVLVQNSTQGNKPTFVVQIQTDENVAHGITTILNNGGSDTGNGGGLGGYKISGLYVRWPSVTTLFGSLPRWALILVLALIGFIILLVVVAHIRARNVKGLLNLSNVVFTVFSFALCVWFFTVLKSATTTKNNIDNQSQNNNSNNVFVTTVDGSVFLPYFIAFAVALFMTPILNAVVLLFQWKRVLRRDPEFRVWVSAHPNITALTLFLCLFSISNIFAITDPVLGALTAPMASHTRLMFSAFGLWGGVFEFPRLVIQFLLIGLYPSQNTAAAAWLPLSLGMFSFFLTVLQRCYALGYLRGTVKEERDELALDGIH